MGLKNCDYLPHGSLADTLTGILDLFSGFRLTFKVERDAGREHNGPSDNSLAPHAAIGLFSVENDGIRVMRNRGSRINKPAPSDRALRPGNGGKEGVAFYFVSPS